MAAGILLFLLLPVLHMAFSSLWFSAEGMLRWTGFAGYRLVLQDRGLRFSLVISVLWCTAVTAGTLVTALHLAVFMSEGKKAVNLLFPLLFIPWVMPVYIAAPLWRAAVHGNGGDSIISWILGVQIPMRDSPPAGFLTAVVLSIWMHLPAPVFVIYGQLRKIPGDTIDASRIDGCSRWGRIPHLYRPILSQALLMLAFLTALSSIAEFSLIFLLTGGGPPMLSGITQRYVIGATTTLGVFLYQVFQGIHQYQVTASAGVLAAAVTGVLLILWKASVIDRPARRQQMLQLICVIGHLIPLGRFHLIFAMLYLAGMKHPRLFLAVALAEILVVLHQVTSMGVLEGFTPAVMLTLIAAAAALPEGFGRSEACSRTVHRAAVFLGVMMLCTAAFLMLAVLVYLSFSGADIAAVSGIIPPFASAEAYRRVVLSTEVWRSIANSVIIAAGTALLLLVMIVPGAMYLHDRRKQTAERWVSGTHMVSVSGGMHTLIPLLFLLAPLGLLDTRTAVMAVYAAGTIAPALMIMLEYFKGFPVSLKEAARIEGAGELQWLTMVMVPLSLPAVAVCALLGFMKGYNGFLVPLLLLRSESLYPVSLQIFRFAGDAYSSGPQWSSFAVLSIIHLAAASAVLHRTRNPLGKTALREMTD